MKLKANYTIGSEKEFYRFYFSILEPLKSPGDRISQRQLELLAAICSKSPDFEIKANREVKNRANPKQKLAKEIGVNKTTVYHMIHELHEKGLLWIDDDKIYRLPGGIEQMRKAVKKSMNSGDDIVELMLNLRINGGTS